MRVVFLVPRRKDAGHRDRLWELSRRRWQRDFPNWPIYEGHHDDGPFNRAAAINTASALADRDGRWDVAILVDSDVMARRSQVLEAVRRASAGAVTWAHLRWRELKEYWTHRTLADRRLFGPEFEDVDLDILVAETNPISWSCCVAIPRSVFDEMGGFDERFKGWGFEDGAWAAHVRGLYRWDRVTVVPGDEQYPAELQRPADVINLWHPRSPERIVLGESAGSASPDYIRNALLGRRYMVAAIRDHKAGDQLGEERLSDEMVAIHVNNLKKDDAKFLRLAAVKGMPEASWTDWWPTLEELRDGVTTHRAGPRPTVTVIVHTGGTDETWAERSAYLRQSLVSLSEMVSGPIVQRVIYSDWGAERRDDLAAIAEPFGFYVVGDGHHGYTGSMQRMWRYLARRAKGEFVFATEDDFLFARHVELAPMIDTLGDNPNLVQIALLRDAFYQDERETGGILGWPEPAFTRLGKNGTSRLEHRLFYTCNPGLIRRSLTERPWPNSEHSETVFGKSLLRDEHTRFAFWGNGEEWVKHIGNVRAGSGY